MGVKIKIPKNPQSFQQNPKKSQDQKLTPQKSHSEFPSLENFQKPLNDITCCTFLVCDFKVQNYEAGIRGHYHESSDCFEYSKKSLLKSSHPKTILAQFSYPKNSQIENFKPPKIFRSSLLLQIWSTPPDHHCGKCMRKLYKYVNAL